jgi:hypothetical protein
MAFGSWNRIAVWLHWIVHCRRIILYCVSTLHLDIRRFAAMRLTTGVLRASVYVVFETTILDA